MRVYARGRRYCPCSSWLQNVRRHVLVRMWSERRTVVAILVAAGLLIVPSVAECQSSAGGAASAQAGAGGTVPSSAIPPARKSPGASVLIGLDQAIQLALDHNHLLQADRTLISQGKAEEVTANLRPNPVLSLVSQYIPLFTPSEFTADNLNQSQEFDAGIAYLFERGHKRQRRLQAARDQTAVTTAQVADAKRNLTFQVAQQFISVLLAESTLQSSLDNLKSFEQTVGIAKEKYTAGSISQGDYLKIKLQLLQFETDVSAARLARAEALIGLRQFMGLNSVPDDYDVAGKLQFAAVHAGLEDLEAEALRLRPDLQAATLGVTAAKGQIQLAKANGKQDVTGQFNYVHTAGDNDATISASIPWAIFNKNQGEIERTRFALTQAEELKLATSDAVLSDVSDAYRTVTNNAQVVKLYTSGYLNEAKESRDISQYAYTRGAASLLDFLDAERSYRSIQLSYLQVLSSYMTAVEQLKEAVGTRTLP